MVPKVPKGECVSIGRSLVGCFSLSPARAVVKVLSKEAAVHYFKAALHCRRRRPLPADWHLLANEILSASTEILHFVETLQRVSKSAEVGPA